MAKLYHANGTLRQTCWIRGCFKPEVLPKCGRKHSVDARRRPHRSRSRPIRHRSEPAEIRDAAQESGAGTLKPSSAASPAFAHRLPSPQAPCHASYATSPRRSPALLRPTRRDRDLPQAVRTASVAQRPYSRANADERTQHPRRVRRAINAVAKMIGDLPAHAAMYRCGVQGRGKALRDPCRQHKCLPLKQLELATPISTVSAIYLIVHTEHNPKIQLKRSRLCQQSTSL